MASVGILCAYEKEAMNKCFVYFLIFKHALGKKIVENTRMASNEIENEKISVVFITDSKYATNTAVAIASLKHNRNTDVQYEVFLISDNVSKDIQNKICSMKEQNFHIKIVEYMNDIKKSMPQGTYVSTTALAKFFLADILDGCDKVIYLDGDVIVQNDLMNLYNVDIEDYYAAVVRDILSEQMKPNIIKRLRSDLQHYFNSGVMLLNLRKMREENLSKALLEYKMNGINYFMDQDALNVIFKGNVRYLPCQYNYMIALDEKIRAEDIDSSYGFDVLKTEMERVLDAHVIHLAGLRKPWEVYIPYATDVFMKYYRMSPFSEEEMFCPAKDAAQCQQYLFPFELIRKGSKIAIWGAGKVGRAFYNQVKFTQYCEMVLWVDEGYKELAFDEKVVDSPEKVKSESLDYIVIAVRNEDVMEMIKKEIFKLRGNCKNVVWRYPVVSI